MGLYLGSTKIPAISFYKQSGIIPSGVFNIPSTSGTYDVTSYAFAQVPNANDTLAIRVLGELSEYNNSSASVIADFAFAYTKISSISMPSVKTIGYSAFYNCSSLTSVYFPSCEVIRDYVFQNSSNLISVNLPSVS